MAALSGVLKLTALALSGFGMVQSFFTADVQAPECLPNPVFADAKALGPFGQIEFESAH